MLDRDLYDYPAGAILMNGFSEQEEKLIQEFCAEAGYTELIVEYVLPAITSELLNHLYTVGTRAIFVPREALATLLPLDLRGFSIYTMLPDGSILNIVTNHVWPNRHRVCTRRRKRE